MAAKVAMFHGKYVFAQIFLTVSRYEFKKCVSRYNGNYKIHHFSCWQQFLYMSFGQLTYRESIRDIFNCLTAHESKSYHLGFKKLVSHTSLSRANESRNWKIWSDFALHLISVARPLYKDDKDFTLELENTVYALDSSTIDLCASIFKWAEYKKNKKAIKIHAMLDLRGNIPVFIEITDGKLHDVNILDRIEFEVGAFYIVDKGYYDFLRLYRINLASAFFVIRAKSNLKCRRIYSNPVDKKTGIRYDQVVKLTGRRTLIDYPDKFRRIKYYDVVGNKTYIFLTNNFTIDAILIAELYKNRWHIELFFKWIK